MRVLRATTAMLVLAASPLLAQQWNEPDREGCRDSRLLSRMQGCSIYECETKDFDQAVLWTGPTPAEGERPTQALEGQKELIHYACPPRLSQLQIIRNATNALTTAGFTVVGKQEGKDQEMFVTARKDGQWVQVFAEEWGEGSSVQVTTLRVGGMAQEMTATAEGLAAEIGRAGRVAVYGINFDTGKATLRPDSDAVLGEIVKLMKANPGWRLGVEGHTDSVGQKAANLALSEQRAAAVVAWLSARGIDKARLVARGLGDTKPVADNATEDGRAKNRRVELVKQ
ncbi:MAG TPA: OmpA family protein [Vicinamibacteria bacterium]|nr:OmpA family protein [Vicinamibacteria bacterium]